jgi:FixJ family two-component response regulator
MVSRPAKIAVIDDDCGNRAALASVLSALGYRTELYPSAEEFVDFALRTEASCLLLDIQLGGMSGVELGRYLARFGFAFPIIFMTGSDSEKLRRQALQVAHVAYLRKPFSADRLFEAVTRALNSSPD